MTLSQCSAALAVFQISSHTSLAVTDSPVSSERLLEAQAKDQLIDYVNKNQVRCEIIIMHAKYYEVQLMKHVLVCL